MAEIDDDTVTTWARKGRRIEFREVEVELADDAPDRLGQRLTKRLRSAGASASPVPKVARALGIRELGPPDPGSVVDLDRRATTAELVRG